MHRRWTQNLSRNRLTAVGIGGTMAFAVGGVVYRTSCNRILLEAVESTERRKVDSTSLNTSVTDVKLLEHAGTFSAPPTSGIARYDVCQTARFVPSFSCQ